MDARWLTGFIEGSGCFSIVIRTSNTQIGYQTIADFTLKLPIQQQALLEEISTFLGVGKVYVRGKQATLKATKLEDAHNLVRFFTTHAFVSPEKQREFVVWKQCVARLEDGKHHTKEGVLEIAHLRDSIHLKNLWNKKNYCSLRKQLDPCHIYEQTNSLPQGCRVCWEGELVQLPKERIHA